MTTKTMDLENTLQWLAGFSEGTAGVTRLLYDKVWSEAHDALRGWMIELGFSVYHDEAGNLFGRVQGRTDEVILTGSHLDSVTNGGSYDGAYGIIASILSVHALVQQHGTPEKTLEVVVFCEEEGSRFPYTYLGSKYLTGAVAASDLEIKDKEGITIAEAKANAGFPETLLPGGRADIEKFLEIHIEQGNQLETSGESIGVAEAIVGQHRYNVYVTGKANHAGTTPMAFRSDAMEGASAMIQSALRLAREKGDPLVATVGQMEVTPNAVNVIPGFVRFSLDIRHPENADLTETSVEIQTLFEQIAEKFGLTVTMERFMQVEPVKMKQEMCQDLADICDAQKQPYRRMFSGAGHDAQVMGSHFPSALLFVPSKDGVSHAPHEFTAPEHLEAGLQVMQEALKQWAYEINDEKEQMQS